MISRDTSGHQPGALPWSDDCTTTKYEPAQLRYLQRSTSPRSMPPPPPLRATAPANQVAAPQLSFFETTERTENPFVRERADAYARVLSVVTAAALLLAVLFARVLLYTASGADEGRLPRDTTPAPVSAASPPAATIEAPAPQPEPAPASEPQPLAAARTPTAPHKPAVKHAAHATSPEPEPEIEASAPAPVIAAAPRVETPQPAPAVTGFGTVRINSRPWSQVFVDGRLLGNTPQLGVRLPAGHHTLRLVNPEFNMTKTLALDVNAGENITRVETLED